ncbi:hypothetical protein BDM02DRAFT_3133407 [Thelephora ganbajun]|uniref:Uncharacterized protein n=1 Tax=Thelephora ganbajun TaxID=370292 RepID=A0ACB6YX48_THEGA|nr:hypothetical protein BDM02DRAFT_3133407 [Thelephora ganbajun]
MSLLGPCMLEFRFSPETEWVLTSHHHVLVVLLASPFHKHCFLKVASRKGSLREESGCLCWWKEMGGDVCQEGCCGLVEKGWLKKWKQNGVWGIVGAGGSIGVDDSFRVSLGGQLPVVG